MRQCPRCARACVEKLEQRHNGTRHCPSSGTASSSSLEPALPSRGVLAILLAPALLSLCTSGPPPCKPGTLAQIEAEYSAKVVAACKGYPSIDACPAGSELRQERSARELDAGCR